MEKLSSSNHVVIVSDSDDDGNSTALSPLTNLKPLTSHKKSKRKKTLGTTLKRQTKLDSYFLKAKSQIKNGISTHGVEITSKTSQSSAQKSKPNIVVLSPPKKTIQLKRSAEKGMSPQSKVSNSSATRITDLKGLYAVV